MKRKSLIVLLLVLILAFVTAFAFACGGNNDQQTQKPDTDIEQGSDSDDNEDDEDPTTHTHSPQFTAANDATCTTDGNIAYWYCAGCNKYFNDEDCTEEITNGVTVAATHHLRLPLTKHDRKEASCTENGNILYYECQDCHKYFDSETATNEIPQNYIVLPAGHKFPATYQTNETEHWKKCENCPQEDERGLHQYGEDNECDVCGYVRDFTAGLQYENIDGKTCKVTGIGDATTETDIIIPATHDGRKVVEIANFAFSENNGNVQSITIPESVTKIGQYVFDGCTKLSEVIWNAANCTQVGGTNTTLFHGCTSVKSIVVGENVQRLPKGVFDGCSSLLSITLPFVGDKPHTEEDTYQYPFGYIFGTSEFSGGTAAEQYYYGYSTSSTTSATYFIPTSLKTVTITGSSYIQYGAFYNCSGLTEITIPESVTSIGYYAFYKCSNLQTLTFENTSELQSIGSCAFYGCSSLNEITIPANVTSIGYEAFDHCSGLTKVNITDLAAWCNIDFGGDYSNPLYYAENLYINDVQQAEITIPQEVTEIKNYAFYYCTSITSVTIPASVTSIGERAFYKCTNLQTVSFNDNSNLQSIGDRAFYNCVSLSEITIPASVASIGGSAFAYCNNIQTVTFGDKSELQSIGIYAFEFCGSLTEITIPASVASIGYEAFYKCTNLQTVNWNATNCTTAGTSSYPIFSSCTSLATVNIGANVETIPAYAFSGFTGLQTVKFDRNSKLESIGSSAFYGCSKLTEITIPASVTSIGNSAFYGCSKLTEITIPASVTSIGYYAFYKCSNLQTVSFNDNSKLESIGSWAFENCSSLNEITIPASVTSIGNYAFSGCSSLNEITIPASVTAIGYEAFYKCTNLQTVKFEDPNGWKVSRNSDMSEAKEINSSDLATLGTAAKYLRSTNSDYYWKKG